jgi:hypothetical protein
LKKRAVVILMAFGLALGVGRFCRPKPVEAKPEKPSAEQPRLSRDPSGRPVISMSKEDQAKVGVTAARPGARQLRPELKVYGKVLDPGLLATNVAELWTAQVASVSASNYLASLKDIDKGQVSIQRSMRLGEAQAQRDRAMVQSVAARLASVWGKGVAENTNLPGLVELLTAGDAALLRLELPIGQSWPKTVGKARVRTPAGSLVVAEFLGETLGVDPLTLGCAGIFLVQPNTLPVRRGEPVTGYLELAEEPIAGVIVSSDALVWSEGTAWVYRAEGPGNTFTRIGLSLDHPTEGGWLVTSGLTTNDFVVVTGAQSLLSEELKASLRAD